MPSKRIQTAKEGLIGFDDRTHRFFERYVGTPPVRALDLSSKLGDQPEIRFIAASLMVAGTVARNARLVRAGARMIIAHEAATLAKNLVKTEIDRKRPRSASHLDEKIPKKGKRTAKEDTQLPVRPQCRRTCCGTRLFA